MVGHQPFVAFVPLAALGVAMGLLLSSCDSPSTAALRELDRRGIPARGVSLADAVERGDAETLSLLLAADVFPDYRDTQGRTPMFLAFERDDLSAAYRLLDAGADPDAAADNGVTVVSLAVSRSEMAVLDRLLDAGACLAGRMPDGDALVPWSIRHGRLLLLKHIFTHGGLDPNQRDATDAPLAHVALDAGRMEILDSLLECGADPSVRNAAGTPLVHAALARGEFDLVGRLLDLGADPVATDANGRSLFFAALDAGCRQLVATLVRSGACPRSCDWDKLLLRLCRENDLLMLDALLSAGVSAMLRDEQGHPIAETAFAEGRSEAAILFLRFGAPPGDALYQSCLRGDHSTVESLLEHFCGPNPSRAPRLDTPLAAAVRFGQTRIVREMLDAGAYPETPGLEGQRPLAVAALLGHGDIVGLLLDHDADPSRPLQCPVLPAFLARADPSVQWLLKRDERVRPLMLAADSGDTAAIRHLLDHGARRNRYTRYNKLYPINFASNKGHVAAMRMLLGKDQGKEQRRIVIDISEQRARVFDATDKEIFVTPVSTGKKGYSTPTGEYVITNKYRHWTSTVYHASMPYFQRLSCGDFGLHQGYVPGYPASHGCIRVPSGKANRLFTLTELGDRVEIVE